MFAGMLVLKKRMPSAPIVTLPLPLAPLVATLPRSVTNASPLTSVHCELVSACTNKYESSPALNDALPITKPSDPTRSDLNILLETLGGVPLDIYRFASPDVTVSRVRQAPTAVFCVVRL